MVRIHHDPESPFAHYPGTQRVLRSDKHRSVGIAGVTVDGGALAMNARFRASQTADELFKARKDLEDLTRRYVEGLLASHTSAQEHVRWLTSILESAADGLVVFDRELEVVLANPAALSLAGWNVGNLSRKEFRSKYQISTDQGKTHLREDEEPIVIAMREKRPVEIEGLLTGYLLPPQGMWVRVNAAPILDDGGSVVGGVSVFQDISERKRLQRQRDTLATLIAHDLKNHLASEQMFFDLLVEENSERFSPDEMGLLLELRRSNERYFDIARTLLEINRTDLLEPGFKPEKIDVTDVVKSVIDLNSHPASVRDVELKLVAHDRVPPVTAITSAIHQVFHNLVQNAINVSLAGQSVEISVSKAEDGVLVEVKDRGPGLSPEQVAELFEGSAGLKSLPKSTVSTRFGLYLCRLLVEQHGGQIRCRSVVGEGTTLSVTVPFEPPE